MSCGHFATHKREQGQHPYSRLVLVRLPRSVPAGPRQRVHGQGLDVAVRSHALSLELAFMRDLCSATRRERANPAAYETPPIATHRASRLGRPLSPTTDDSEFSAQTPQESINRTNATGHQSGLPKAGQRTQTASSDTDSSHYNGQFDSFITDVCCALGHNRVGFL